MNRLSKLLLFAVLAAPGIGQMENAPYFALNSSRTYGTGEKATIALTGWNVDELEFRVYRVKDPVKFFEQIEDPHQFGTSSTRHLRKPTLIEQWRSWKSGMRYEIRHGLRAQFTESPSAKFGRTAAPKAVPQATHYAEIPLLNSQQLVLRFTQALHVKERWASQTVPVDVKEKGLYLVEAVTGTQRAYTVLMVSDLAAITKVTHGRVVTFAVDRTSGQPVEGAEAFLLIRDHLVAQKNTDANGLAELAPTDTKTVVVSYRLVVRKGADVAVLTPSPYSIGPNQNSWTGLVYTDRPVYRPGHPVHVKAFARIKGAIGYAIPPLQAATLEIKDPEGKQIHQRSLMISASGTVQDDLELPAKSALGMYSIELRAGENTMSGNFEVQEYKKPEYEVRVQPVQTRVLQGAKVSAVIDAHYYFGEPVAKAKMQYSIYRSRYWFPFWYGEQDNGEAQDEGEDNYDSQGAEVTTGEAQLDADGKATIEFEAPLDNKKFDARYRIEARVTDEARREISGTGYALGTYGSYAINTTPERWFVEPGSQAGIKLDARNYDNQPVPARMHLELLRWDWSKRSAEKVGSSADGIAGSSVDLRIPNRGGSYRILATSHTPEGRDVQQETWLWVAGSSDSVSSSGDTKTIPIVPDQKTYKAGDKATILIVAGEPNTSVLVTVEGRELRSTHVMRSRTATVELQLPIASSDEPGFYVSATFIRDGSLYQASKLIKVPPVTHALSVALSTDKPQYQPGQTAAYNVLVTGSDGKPAANFNLSLGVVDEAIYAIRHDATPDILNFFYGREYDAVETDSSLQFYFTGEAGTRRMRLAFLHEMSRLAQIKPDRLVQPKIRKLFPDTAFWASDITTDAGGRAKAIVLFPDSLTTWRATARGMTLDSRAGSAVLKTIVRKNLILRLAVPRFFTQGDEVQLSSLVHNYLPTSKTVHVTFKASGLQLLGSAAQDVVVPSRGEMRVNWRVRAQSVREAIIDGAALTDEESDAVQLTLPVNPAGIKLALPRSGALAGSKNAAFDLTFPQHVEPGSRTLSIRVAPSIAGSLFNALDYLTAFPYGCVEQTMSSFLPNIIVSQTVQELSLKSQVDRASLADKVNAGLDRLYAFQHSDGGWGWWETDESHPFMTPYVVAGLAQAKLAGYNLKPEVIHRGVVWLQKNFESDTNLNPDLRAYFAYALVTAGETASTIPATVYQQRNRLSPYGVALLGLALEGQKDSRASELAAQLERTASQDSEQAWWDARRDELLDISTDATPEATAYAVKLLSHQRPSSPLLPKAALWLMNYRTDGYVWHSTKQTAMVIYGLIDYLKTTHELQPDITATVYVNETAVLTRRFGPQDAAASASLDLDESKLQAAVNHIRVEASGNGRIYYSTTAEYYSNEDRYQRTGQWKLNLVRDYFKLVPAKVDDRIVYDTVPLVGAVNSGDVIAVRLTLTGTDWKYLLIEDPIPAGTEFIEKDNLFELRARPPWWLYEFDRREVHDDRMAIFQTHFPEGQHQYFYLLKVVNPGLFRVSPARVQPMYQPEFLSATESRTLEVK